MCVIQSVFYARASGGFAVCSNQQGTWPPVHTCQVNECGGTGGCQLRFSSWMTRLTCVDTMLHILPYPSIGSWAYHCVYCVLLPLQVILCLSSMGTSLRVRARRFPALVQCTTIDWFHPWTSEALQSVSYQFLQEIEGIEVGLQIFYRNFIFISQLLFSTAVTYFMILQFVGRGCIHTLYIQYSICRVAISSHCRLC